MEDIPTCGMERDIPIKIAGTGPCEEQLIKRAENSNLENVEFLGFKSGQELQEIVQKASFSVIPSMWYENCPMSVLESFAYGKPVIGAKIGGIPELIEEGTDGYVFEAGNAKDLAKTMTMLMSDPGKRKGMGRGKWGHPGS